MGLWKRLNVDHEHIHKMTIIIENKSSPSDQSESRIRQCGGTS